jgi:metal-responsive CopG/Arc/MetJ family transcriptional regulator
MRIRENANKKRGIKKITIYILDDILKQLRIMAISKGISMSELIRNLIENGLQENNHVG